MQAAKLILATKHKGGENKNFSPEIALLTYHSVSTRSPFVRSRLESLVLDTRSQYDRKHGRTFANVSLCVIHTQSRFTIA